MLISASSRFAIVALLALGCGSSSSNRRGEQPGTHASGNGPPVAEVRPVTDTYHGVEVVDPYRWLENWEDPAVREWSSAQNTHARRALAKLPHRSEIRARLRGLLAAPATHYWTLMLRGEKTFALVHEPPREQPSLVVMESLENVESARVLVDPVAMDESGAVAIDWYVPTPDGRLVAVSLSRGGTESGDVHVYDVASGSEVHEVVPRVNGGTAGGDLVWQADGSGFFYTRYPRPGERPDTDLAFYQQVYFHRLGTPSEQDRYEIGKELPRIAEIELEADHPSGRVLATVQNGDGGEFALFLRTPDGTWRRFSDFGDGIEHAFFGKRDGLYLLSRRDAPRRKILRTTIAALDPMAAETVIDQGADAIAGNSWGATSLLVTDSRLFVRYQLGGPTEIRSFDHDGKPVPGPTMLPVPAARSLREMSGDRILFRMGSYLEKTAWYRFDAGSGETVKLDLDSPSPVDTRGFEVAREHATSKDGTRVPVNVIKPKAAAADGSHPCLVTGYGGFGISRMPYLGKARSVLLEQGIVVVETNLRGGGEFGEEWHRQGNLTNKQNVFDDFAAAIEHVIARKYCSAERLAIKGGSNGGLLVGAAMTQHPDLMTTVVASVGYFDMLRYDQSPNGQFNVTEYGSVKDPDQFRALHAYSPYHNVEAGTRYPAALFLTGANDPRVAPWHSRKMVARVQAANAAATPILLRTSSTSGHGGAKSLTETIEELTDVYAFLLDRLGVNYRAVESRTPQPVAADSQR